MKANKSSGIEFLFGITALLIFQLLGEVSVRLLDLPVPGPVAGLLYLLLLLLIMGKFNRPAPESLEQSSLTLLNHLSLLFVPAGVGVMVHFQRLEEEWLPITVALFLGVLITMATTALSMKFLMRFFDNKTKETT